MVSGYLGEFRACDVLLDLAFDRVDPVNALVVVLQLCGSQLLLLREFGPHLRQFIFEFADRLSSLLKLLVQVLFVVTKKKAQSPDAMFKWGLEVRPP